MALKVLIVDSDIQLTIPVKQALENTGEFTVNVFAGGKAAIEAARREPPDAVILDFNVADVGLSELIQTLRRDRPQFPVFVSGRGDEALIQALDSPIQGRLSKPYFARQLASLIRKAVGPQRIAEPMPQPDDTFYRLIEKRQPDDKPPTVALTVDKALQIDEPPLPEEATIRELVTGQTSAPPATMPETPATTIPDETQPDLAAVALETVNDQTVPLDRASLQAIIAKLEQTSGEHIDLLPEWLRQSMAQPLAEPSFVQVLIQNEDNPAMSPEDSAPKAPDPQSAQPLEPAAQQEPDSQSAQSAEPIATLAVQLTQLTVDLSAQATLVSHTESGNLIAAAGSLSNEAIDDALRRINEAWQSITDETTTDHALIRFIHITYTGDFLLYSTRTVDKMLLSMLFSADTPQKVIRRQARQLINALSNVPESPAESSQSALVSEPPAAQTLPSRPTDLRPPEGLRSAEVEPPLPPPVEIVYATYTLVWLPQSGSLATDVTDSLLDWLTQAATQKPWRIEGTEIQPTYVSIQVSIPVNETPTAAADILMRETAVRAGNDGLWADACYIVSSGRAITQQEIAAFVEFQREAQEVE